MLTQHIALVPTSDGVVDPSELARVSAALQKQVTRDLAPLWGVSATVDAFPQLEDVPLGYWPLLVSTGEGSHETGRFCDENGQPYAHVLLSPHWSVVASRTCLEMLVSPSGTRGVVCRSPRYDQGLVQVLVEICAACEDPSHAYVINDVLVSDFCTPGFYASEAISGHERGSFYGSIAAPLQLLIGGHLTWFDSPSESWWLRTQHDGEPVDTQLGSLNAEIGSVRELVQRYAPPGRRTWTLSYGSSETRARVLREQAALATQARARQLRLIGGFADAFEDVTREFELSDLPAPTRSRDDSPAGLETPAADAEQRQEQVSPDEQMAPLGLVAASAARRSEPPPMPASAARPRTTEGSIVASFVLPPPDPLPAAEAVPAGLTPARPEESHAAAREASDARPAASQPKQPAPPSSSIAPPALALMAPERTRQGLDARLLAGALVLAVLAVLAFTQRRARSTPGAARPAAVSQVVPAPVGDASAAPAPLAPAAPEPALAPSAAAAASEVAPPAPPVAPAASESPPRPRRAAETRERKPDVSGKETPIEALFDTRR